MSNTITKSQGTRTDTERVRNIKTRLIQWAHQGDWESLDKINDFIKREKDRDLKAFAEIARNEASFFYYSPNIKSEETDFLMAKMIREKEKESENLTYKLESAQLELDRLEIEKKVSEKLIKTKKVKKDCEYLYCEGFADYVANRHMKAKDKLEFNNKWIDVAQSLIVNKKYLNIPYDVLDSIHIDGEDDISWMNDCMDPEERE